MLEQKDLSVGQKVHYAPDHGKIENGIIKEIPEHTQAEVRVVYNCGGNWDHYENYTSALTNLRDLRLGWSDEARNI